MLRTPPEPQPYSLLDVIEGFYLAHILTALECAGVLKSLEKWTTAVRLAHRHRINRNVLEAALQILAARTRLIAHRAGKYRLARQYDFHARFMFFQYLGAYGRHAMEFGRILRHPSAGHNFIDRKQHAKAFCQQGILTDNILADLLLQLGLNHILDLGCGTGTLLLNLAGRDREFVGWGLDMNKWMCAAARKRIASLGVTRRVRIFQGDCRDLKHSIPGSVIARVSAVTAGSLINEFFAAGVTKAVECLAGIRAMFPGRTMLIADYYGQLGVARRPRSREVALHDFIQVISGQGVPPANLSTWKKIYRQAGCDFIHAVGVQDSPFFIHILKL